MARVLKNGEWQSIPNNSAMPVLGAGAEFEFEGISFRLEFGPLDQPQAHEFMPEAMRSTLEGANGVILRRSDFATPQSQATPAGESMTALLSNIGGRAVRLCMSFPTIDQAEPPMRLISWSFQEV